MNVILQPSSYSSSPVNSPNKDNYGDRFIPSRAGSNWQISYNMIQDQKKSQTPTKKAREATTDNNKDGIAYSCLLKNELLGAGIEDLKEHSVDRQTVSSLECRNMYRVCINRII